MYNKTIGWCQVGAFGICFRQNPYSSVLSVVANLNSPSDMVLDSPDGLFDTLLPTATNSPILGLSSSKVLTSKLGSLESKFVALEVLVNSILVMLRDIDLGLGIGVLGLLFSTLAEMQAIALALECVPPSSSVHLFSNSQTALDACKSELGLVCPDFYNPCWVKHQLIMNTICNKNLKMNWHKVKDYSGVVENKYADAIARASSHSG
ncbi:hypothetical protein G9A89_002729 [Geosiphon pyriformis]|nr:hypothetical protein G9A89_002729 [Geosiphon pyriformis]